MAELDITEVETDSLIKDLIQHPEDEKVVKRDEIELPKEDSTDLHVYIAFKDQVTIYQGMQVIESQVCGGKSLQVTREDKTGNAIVAIVSGEEAKAIEKLDEVSFIKIDAGANTTTALDNSDDKQTTQEKTNQNTTNKDNSKKSTLDKTDTKTDNKTETAQEITAVSDNHIDTGNKSIYGPILVTVVLLVALILGILFVKRNK